MILDYFAAHMWQLWAIVCIVCLILELFSGDFFIMCFSIGAFVACIASLLIPELWGWQILIFAVVSVLCLFFVRPVALRYLHRSKGDKVSNADALIGRVGRVSQAIEADGFGRVAIDGDDWKAQTADGTAIEKGVNVKVVGRDSIIITVERE
jgi:membrane protein implicated in regulation of membrane protease activity